MSHYKDITQLPYMEEKQVNDFDTLIVMTQIVSMSQQSISEGPLYLLR